MSKDLGQRAKRLMAKGRQAAKRSDQLSARTCFEEAVNLRRRVYGPASKWLAESLDRLAATFTSQGDHRSARNTLEDLLTVRKAMHGEEHARAGNSLHVLGRTACSLGNSVSAKKYTGQALAVRRQPFGETHPDVAAASTISDLSTLLLCGITQR